MVLLAALVIALLPTSAVFADRGAAEFFASRGEQALKSKSWADAEEQYRRALGEDGTYLPARYGLAQALVGAGRTAPAVEELRAFVAAVGADASSPADWKAMARTAEKQLADIDASGAELRKILDRYADDLVALARKVLTKDPGTADRAARRALEIRPDDRQAAELIERMGGSVKGPPVQLLNGKDFANWEKARFPQWSVEEGFAIGDTRDGAFVIRSHEEFENDFDLVMEGRFVDERGGDPMMALLGTMQGEYDYYCLGILNRKITVFEGTGEGKRRDLCRIPLSEFRGSFDMADWNRFEIRYRGAEVEFLVNGTSVAKEARPESRRKGFVGLYIQDARIAFRRVEAQPR